MGSARRMELRYRVRFDEAGPDGLLRSSGYLRFAQDIAWQHSDLHGFDRDWYRARGLLWLVRSVQLQVMLGVRNGDVATVSTEVIGARRMWARRRSEVCRADGELAALVTTDWVLMRDDGRPASVPHEVTEQLSDATPFEPARVPLHTPVPHAWTMEVTVRPQDLDPMGHVNNATYVDYLSEVLAASPRGQEGPLTDFRLEYLRPAAAGEHLLAAAWRDGDRWAVSIRGEAGDVILRASAA